MKILILSCKTGQGHNSVANAIAETLENRGHDGEILDALRFISDGTAKFMSWGHSFIYCHCPEVFQAGYEAAERHPNVLGEGSLAYRFFARGAQDLYEYCAQYHYDAVICTHVFAALMFTEARHSFNLPVPGYFVATDYTSYPGVQESDMDAYFIPDDCLAEAYSGKRTVTCGIPVYQQFFTDVARAEAKAALGLDCNKTHILMMCGSMGCGPIEEIAQRIAIGMDDDCIMSIVCGTNHRLYQRLCDAYRDNKKVQVHGYVQNVSLMMAAADIYVTKPGGISTTEAMVRGLPMVLVDAVAGCEDYNMRYFRDLGGAVGSKDPKRIAQLCLELADNPLRRERMSGQLLQSKKNGAVTICDYLQQRLG